ncbi:MAG: helix-turn-helix domain-containing protein [Pyrinomonadaceae bacterium]
MSSIAEAKLAKADKIAQILDVDKHRVYQLAREVFPAGVVVRLGRQVRFDEAALRHWITKGGSAQTAEAA